MYANRPGGPSAAASAGAYGGHGNAAPPKYIFDNGIKKINPAYNAYEQAQAGGAGAQTSSVAQPHNALAIVSSMEDVDAAEAAQFAPVKISESTVASLEIIQDEDYVNKYNHPQVDGGKIIDGLGALFEKFEVPIGLVNKLLVLSEYKLHFVVDDSGSMTLDSDVRGPRGGLLTRWQEAEERLKQMMYVMSYVPCEGIQISFMNRPDTLEFGYQGRTPEAFQQDALRRIEQAFANGPRGGTPTLPALQRAFGSASGPTAVYLMTDGVPTSIGGEKAVEDFVLHRGSPQAFPMTFMSCTNQDDEAEWMKKIEERAPYTAELDDFEDEKGEVLKDQGGALPYSYGMWLISNLCAAMHPDDLDAMDESVPFAKRTLDNLLGYETSPREYDHYFNHHAYRWGSYKNDFVTAKRAGDIPAVQHYRAQLQQGVALGVPYCGASSSQGTAGRPGSMKKLTKLFSKKLGL